MESSERGQLALPVAGVFVLLATVGGFIWFDKPLQTRRPQQPRDYVQASFSDEDLQARLWQDPFGPVFADRLEEGSAAAHRDKLAKTAELVSKRTLGALAESKDDAEEPGQYESPSVIVMPVMVPGSSYFEDAEARRRTRQAIVSALAVKGYVAESGERIGYMETRWSFQGRRLKPGPDEVDVPIPFEWFQRDLLRPDDERAESEWVLLLWLNESAFQSDTMIQLSELFGALLRAENAAPKTLPDGGKSATADSGKNVHQRGVLEKVALRLIGPSSSSTLLTLLSQPKREPAGDTKNDENILATLQSFHQKYQQLEQKYPGRLRTYLNPLDGSVVPEDVTVFADAVAEKGNLLSKSFSKFVENQLRDAASIEKNEKRTDVGKAFSDSDFDAYTFVAFTYEDARGHIQPMQEQVAEEITKVSFTRWLDAVTDFLAGKLNTHLPEQVAPTKERAKQLVKGWLYKSETALDMHVNGELTWDLLEGLQIFSNRATAPEALLVRQGDHENSVSRQTSLFNRLTEENVGKRLHDLYGVRFTSTIARDNELAEALVNELQLRGVDLINGNENVVLVSEWDTFYGRALPFSMEAVIQYRRGEESTNWTEAGTLKLMLDGDVKTPPRVHRFSYMRGLDGSTPQKWARSDSSPNGASNKTEKPWDIDFTKLERPVGTSGLDYIRRVAVKLSMLERTLKENGERIGAIGVVGSDVYDKLLVLQALRSRFPNVLFFTTDLDARLLHPSQYQWCRNLIVASSYGLELSPELQKHIPPFRDSYQASTFLACLLALGEVKLNSDGKEISLTGGSDFEKYVTPQIFEVARSGAYDITPLEYASPLHPHHQDGRPSPLRLVKVGLVLFVVFLLVVPVNKTLRRLIFDHDKLTRRDREALIIFASLACLVFAATWIALYMDGKGGEGEPYELFEGISIWPSEMCRLLMILLSWIFLSQAVSSMKESNRMLTCENIASPADDSEADPAKNDEIRKDKPGFWQRWEKVRHRLAGTDDEDDDNFIVTRWIPIAIFEIRCLVLTRLQISLVSWDRELANSGDVAEVETIWNRYQELGRVTNRMWRVVPVVVLYLFFAWCLMLIFDTTPAPYRGPIAKWTDYAVILVTGFSLVGLTFFVVDATRLCEVFIKAIAGRTTQWPKTKFIQEIASARGMQLEDLPDYIDIQVIARRTEVIGKLITYPFVVLFIGLVSVNSYFDNWRLSLHTVLYFGFILVYAIVCAVILRRAAEKARKKALSRMHRNVSKLLKSTAQNSAVRVEQIQMLIEELQQLKRGAFTPLSQHPIIRAILIPFGGIGTVALLDYLSNVGG